MLLVSSLALLLFAFGCSLSPSAQISPRNGSKEVDPRQTIKVSTGFLTSIERIEVFANGQGVEAKISSEGSLHLNGKKTLEADTRYEILLHLRGFRNKRVSQSFAFSTVTTPRPLVNSQALVLKYGEPIRIAWNTPIKNFKYLLPPGIESKSRIERDRKTSVIEILNYKQGQVLDLKVVDAWGVNGHRLRDHNPGFSQQVATTAPLGADIDPSYGQMRVARSKEITLTFGENIVNPEVAARNLIIQPAINGNVLWSRPDKLVFTPTGAWDYQAEVSVTLKGGPGGLKGASGSYIEDDFKSYFVIATYKVIDVNLSTQTLVLLEGGTPIFSTLVSTGKPGYETPAGEFYVYAKDRVVDMGSTPEAVEFYYVKDVPWVLWFEGGYSVHGTYWHNEFGRVRSHGCVNVPVPAAEQIYRWAPVGTPVIVHY
ncbi:MAG: L,D-transpeptidase [Actinomycetota bacterium]